MIIPFGILSKSVKCNEKASYQNENKPYHFDKAIILLKTIDVVLKIPVALENTGFHPFLLRISL